MEGLLAAFRARRAAYPSEVIMYRPTGEERGRLDMHIKDFTR